MRILHVVRSDGWAGVERHIAALAGEQAATGHDVHVIGGDAELVPARIARSDVGFQPASTLADTVRALSRAPVPDLVNVHMTAAEVAVALSPRLRKVPVVSTRHFARRRGDRRLARPVVTLAARRIAAQIAVSQHVADCVEGSSVVVHSGVPARPDAPAASARGRTVLLATRLEAEKHADVAVAAFAASGLHRDGWQLHVAGSGSLLRTLERQVADLGIAPAVRFLGHRADVAVLMDQASLLVAPALHEAFGLSVVEAMAAGLPTVAAASGGHLETIGAVPGAALFPPGDAEAAGRLLALLGRDEAARDTCGRALQAAQRAHFTVAAQAEGTDAVYRTVR